MNMIVNYVKCCMNTIISYAPSSSISIFTKISSSAMEVRERKEKSGRGRARREKKAEEEDSGDETPDPDEIDEANVTRQRLNKDANLRGSAR